MTVPGAFSLENGESLTDVQIAYRTWGDAANAEDSAVLICHALTGSADVEAWWPDTVSYTHLTLPTNTVTCGCRGGGGG